MAASESGFTSVLSTALLVPAANQDRPQLAHRLDGRYGAMDPEELLSLVRELAARVDSAEVDYVVGLPEGGSLPAFAFAQVVGRPLILSTRLALALPGAVSFEEPHSGLGTVHHVYGLRAGDHVILIEDEITTGRTVVNAVRALRRQGIRIDQVVALLAADDPAVWQMMRQERIVLHAGARLPCPLVASRG